MKTNQMDLDKLGLSPRTYNALCRAGILTIDQLCNTTRTDLRRLKNVGNKMVAEIDEKLAAYIATGAAEMELPPEHPCKLDYVQGYLDGQEVFRAAVIEELLKRENIHKGALQGTVASIRHMVAGLEVPAK